MVDVNRLGTALRYGKHKQTCVLWRSVLLLRLKN